MAKTQKTAEQILTDLTEDTCRILDELQQRIDTWTVELKANPFHAMSWGSDVARNAARIDVLKWVLEGINSMQRDLEPMPAAEILQTLAKEAREDVMRKAKYPDYSTSPISNLMSLMRNSALSEFEQDLRNKMRVFGIEVTS